MGLESAGSAIHGSADQPNCCDTLLSELQAARSLLSQKMETAKVVARGLDASNARLQNIAQRLPSLESAMQPLRQHSMDATRFSKSLDDAMAPAAFVLKKYELLRSLEPKILASAHEDFSSYLVACTELEDALQFIARNRTEAFRRLQEAVRFVKESNVADAYRLKRINEALASLQSTENQNSEALELRLTNTALKSLQAEFYRVLVEDSTPVSLPSSIGINEKLSKFYPPLPTPVVQKLEAIVGKIVGSVQMDQCAKFYLKTRSEAVRESLLGLQPRYLQLSSVKAVDNVDWPGLEGYIGDWTKQLEVAVRVLYAGEKVLVKQVFSGVDAVLVSKLFANLAQGGMGSFLQFGQSVARSHKAPEKLFKLLDMFETLQNLDPSIAEVFEGEGCSEIRMRVRELQKQLVIGACQVYRELGRQIDLQKDGTPPPDGGVLKLSSYVVNYVKYLLSEFYSPIMNQVLQIEQSWRNGNVKESGLPQAVFHIMELLESTLLACSQGCNDLALSHIFLMNNYYYMFTRSKGSELGPILGDSWLKQSRSKVQQQALAYQKEGWSRVLSQLSREGLSLSTDGRVASRDLVRQRLKAFTSAFEEKCEQHSKFMISDADLREGVRLAIIQALVPAYRSYIQSYGPLIEQQGDKFLKFSPEALEQKLGELFQGIRNGQ